LRCYEWLALFYGSVVYGIAAKWLELRAIAVWLLSGCNLAKQGAKVHTFPLNNSILQLNNCYAVKNSF
jgi:hypothetical protein